MTGTTTEAIAGPTGVLGGSFRADVTTAGTIVPWDGSPSLAWHVAADDRWHSPADEVAVRQVRTAGAPVFETRVRIPGGDAVQRVWSVADGGGRTLVEVSNESPLPIACALTRGDLLTARPSADVPIEGIALPAGTIVLPIGHRTSVTVALAHEHPVAGPLPSGSATPEATARGWVARAERASRVVLPDERAADRLVTGRADLLLTGPPAADDDPVGFLLALHELVRLGELAGRALDDVVPDIAAAVHSTSRRDGWDVDAALAAAAALLHVAREDRAGRDLARLRASRARVSRPVPTRRPTACGASPRSSGTWPPTACSSPAASRTPGGASTSRPTDCRADPPRRCRSPCAGTASTPPCSGRPTANPSRSWPPLSTRRGAADAASGEALWRLAT